MFDDYLQVVVFTVTFVMRVVFGFTVSDYFELWMFGILVWVLLICVVCLVLVLF